MITWQVFLFRVLFGRLVRISETLCNFVS